MGRLCPEQPGVGGRGGLRRLPRPVHQSDPRGGAPPGRRAYSGGVHTLSDCIHDSGPQRVYLWKLEQLQIHDGTFGRYGGRFDPVARDVYYQEQRPQYHFLGFGVSAESQKRIAVVRVPSTFIRLYVEVSEAFEGARTNKAEFDPTCPAKQVLRGKGGDSDV